MKIDHIETFAFRLPIEKPVATSFGIMTNRPAVFVKLTAQDGVYGWGEIFANWPAAGAEHRARLLIEDVAEILFSIEAETPSRFWQQLNAGVSTRAVQCGEPGPFNQVVAGIDTAINDIAARRAGLPLAQYLNANAGNTIPTYSSGIAIYNAVDEIENARNNGFKNFKVKVGFDKEQDLATLSQLSRNLKPDELLFADANQAWNLTQAIDNMKSADDLGLGWIEEPISAQTSINDWNELAAKIKTPIAAGENIVGDQDFKTAIASNAFSYIQPDVAKWGGITGCYRVGKAATNAGQTYCPHFLGGGIGLIASAHLLTAVGGNGLLELDVNPNILRDAFLSNELVDGNWSINKSAGLGISEFPESILQYQTLALSKSR
ncbi:MAG: mandelate racemase/muconate lactonizing enzyme family protein [Hyphomicrobiales bacterium]